MARLEAFLAAAYIFGPAAGGFLGELGLGVPFIAAGIVAACALLLVCVYLHESLDFSRPVRKSKQKFSSAYLKKLFPPMVVGLSLRFELDTLYDCGVLQPLDY